ncbi:hypothetical protein [Dubosiella newyorkensis]|uniref:hypothetical protein n=1 Tax=Dubosiella newyorkensis TaxID=1862672 RepID=UPI002591BA75|nr:hypothetical protein [Dubosiella newyorkensis]
MEVVMSDFLEHCFRREPIELLKLQNELWKYMVAEEKPEIFEVDFAFGRVWFSPTGNVVYLIEEREEDLYDFEK